MFLGNYRKSSLQLWQLTSNKNNSPPDDQTHKNNLLTSSLTGDVLQTSLFKAWGQGLLLLMLNQNKSKKLFLDFSSDIHFTNVVCEEIYFQL